MDADGVEVAVVFGEKQKQSCLLMMSLHDAKLKLTTARAAWSQLELLGATKAVGDRTCSHRCHLGTLKAKVLHKPQATSSLPNQTDQQSVGLCTVRATNEIMIAYRGF